MNYLDGTVLSSKVSMKIEVWNCLVSLKIGKKQVWNCLLSLKIRKGKGIWGLELPPLANLALQVLGRKKLEFNSGEI